MPVLPPLAGASCFLGIGAPPARAGLSAHAHDGIYAVHIVTQHGSCHNAQTLEPARTPLPNGKDEAAIAAIAFGKTYARYELFSG